MKRLSDFTKRTWILFAVIITTSAGVGMYLTQNNQTPQPQTQTTPRTSPQEGRVFIKDIDKPKYNLSPPVQNHIETTLYRYLSMTELDLYTGVIKSESQNSRQSEFIIDIMPSGATYTVLVTRGASGVVRIHCAPPEKQLTASVSCIDGGEV